MHLGHWSHTGSTMVQASKSSTTSYLEIGSELRGIPSGPPNLTWRFPIAFQIIFALVVAIGIIWLPESPRWLLTQERYEEGTAVIAALRGLEIDDKETQLQKQIIMDSIRASGYAGRRGTPLKAVFTGGKTQHFRRMMLGVSSQFMQQVGGCNAGM